VDKPRYGLEMLIVLFLGLGKSAVYSVLSIIESLTRPNQPLNQQTTTLNTSAVPDRPWLDLAYQVTYIVFPLVQVLLVLYLLHLTHQHARRLIGFDLTRPGRDIGWGFLIAAGIGIPGLGIYLGARALGHQHERRPGQPRRELVDRPGPHRPRGHERDH
jgi:hypothetical protein